METNVNNSISKSDYQKVLRPVSIKLFKETDIHVNPSTKRIINWKFPLITGQVSGTEQDQWKSYLNFNDYFGEVS